MEITDNMVPRKNIFGTLLNRLRSTRNFAVRNAEKALMKRNGLSELKDNPGYVVVSDATVTRRGDEVITLKLWKLVDKSVITIDSAINVTVREGVEKGDESSSRATPADNSKSPI